MTKSSNLAFRGRLTRRGRVALRSLLVFLRPLIPSPRRRMRRPGSVVTCLFAVSTLIGPADAVEVQTWTHRTAADFESGQMDRVVVTSTHQVRLARQMNSLADPGVAHVWAMARLPDGNFVAATGSPGRVVRIAPTGEIETLHESKDEQIFALAVGQDGTIYFGTSPGGDVYKMARDGRPEVLFTTEETYIWSLALDGNSALWAATGSRGRLYRISLEGEGGVHFQTKQKHLLSLAAGENGAAYVGTSNDGLIFRVDADGSGFVLHDAPQADVQALLLDRSGRLYAGTGTPERPNLPAPTSLRQFPPFGVPGRSGVSLFGFLGPLAPVADAPAPPPTSSRPREPFRAGLPAAGENSVYRIARDGQVDEILREKALVLSLGFQGDCLLIGTGQEGRLFLVDPKSLERQTLAHLDSGQIQSMVAQPDGSVVVGTGTPGRTWTVENRYAPRGVLVSEVFDAKMQTRWGKSTYQADVPDNTRLSVEYRAGNVKDTDDTWSSWTRDSSTLPLSRFLQYRAVLDTRDGASTPSLSGLTLYYATVNRPPVIESIEVPDLASSPISDASGKLTIRWKANDPNGDELQYDLDVKKDGWPEWVSAARNVTAQEFAWDPASMPSGSYRFRVTANDGRANRQGEALSATRQSDPFVLDRDPPQVTISAVRPLSPRFEIVASAKDGQTRLTAASYSLDGAAWTPLFPDDGLFDSTEETVTFQTEPLASGSYLLLVRFRDSAGRIGVADTVLRVP